MQAGIDFLENRIDDTIALHRALVQSMTEHESDADDLRYRDLCARHIPHLRRHQTMLEELRASLGAHASRGGPRELAGAVRQFAGTALAAARSLADAPRSDYYTQLVGDLSMARQLEVTFKLFRDGGRQLGIGRLAQLGEIAERHHDEYAADARRLLQQMFAERSQGAADIVRPAAEQSRRFS